VKVYWTEDADRDRRQIYDFIAQDNSDAAMRLDQTFSAAARRVMEFPLVGRVGPVSKAREIRPHENYRLLYYVEGDAIIILAVVHAARRWPPETL